VHARVRLWVGMRKMPIGIANRERSWRLGFFGDVPGSIRRHSPPGTWHWQLFFGLFWDFHSWEVTQIDSKRE